MLAGTQIQTTMLWLLRHRLGLSACWALALASLRGNMLPLFCNLALQSCVWLQSTFDTWTVIGLMQFELCLLQVPCHLKSCHFAGETLQINKHCRSTNTAAQQTLKAKTRKNNHQQKTSKFPCRQRLRACWEPA